MERAALDLPPYTVFENGYIHGTWFCGRPTKPYYGSFPYSFWPRAKRVLKPWGNMLHWFSGLERPEGGIITVDGNGDTKPSVVSVGTSLPFADQTFCASFADPPYSPKDAKRYGLPYPSATKVIAELARVTKIGGKIGLLHEFIPPTKHIPVKLLGVIGVMNGPQKRIRLFAIYRKTTQQMEAVMPVDQDNMFLKPRLSIRHQNCTREYIANQMIAHKDWARVGNEEILDEIRNAPSVGSAAMIADKIFRVVI